MEAGKLRHLVTLQSPTHVVYRGKEISVYAKAWRVIGTDTQPVTNVEFAFSSGSGSIARVDKDCCGYATVTGVNSGNVDIIARVVTFEHAQDADLPLRVSNPLEIDSVRPATVHYLHPIDERSLNLTAFKCVKRRRRRN